MKPPNSSYRAGGKKPDANGNFEMPADMCEALLAKGWTKAESSAKRERPRRERIALTDTPKETEE
jgi:hypothetical protein